MQTSSVSRSDTVQAWNGLMWQSTFAAILNGVLENTEGYTWIVDKDLKYIVCNKHLRNSIKEFTGNEVSPGNPVIDCIGLLDDSQKLPWPTIYATAFNGTGSRFTHPITLQQKPVFFDIAVNPVYEGNTIIALSCSALDITEQKNAEEALLQREKAEELTRESEYLYKNLFYKSPLPKWVCNVGTLQFVEVNEATIQLYGYTRKEFMKMTAFDIMSPEEKQELQQSLPVAYHKNRPSILRRHIKKNNKTIFVEVWVHAINYKGNNAWLVLANDITEKIELQNQLVEEQIRRQQEIAKAVIDAQETERETLGRELHDNISQVLTTARLYLNCARDTPAIQDIMIKRGIETIGSAIEEIRRLSRSMIETFHKEVGLELSLNDLIENIRLVQKCNIAFLFSVPEEKQLDNKLKMTIFRIVQEQLNNTIKHAGASEVQIAIIQKNDLLQVIINDDGKGFDTTRKRKGIGITNIISRTELFNGRVKIDSSPGNGCRMQISFTI